jgi:hypothetical protein
MTALTILNQGCPFSDSGRYRLFKMLLGKAGHIAIGQRSKATQREMNDSVVVKTKKVFYTVGKLVSIELNSFRILFAL